MIEFFIDKIKHDIDNFCDIIYESNIQIYKKFTNILFKMNKYFDSKNIDQNKCLF